MIRPSCTSDVLVASISACGLLALALLAGCGAVSPTKVASDHHVSLTWNASTGATHYNVYRSEISGSYYVLIGSTTNLKFTDAKVESMSGIMGTDEDLVRLQESVDINI